ncbi:hypothetical protein PLESTF_000544500 [Pleodorina starrii]|nr:hypothetical protein PLESTF_000544500 [Pleodorina starrii]
MLAHGLVVTFLRYKFSHYGSPGDGNDGVTIVPQERYVEARLREVVTRRDNPSGAQLTPPVGLDLAYPAQAPGASGSGLCALGVPTYELPMTYAVVGRCEPDCLCPYCCLTAAAEAETAAAAAAAAAASAAQYSTEGPNAARIEHGCASYGVDELYLPGALLPEAAAAGCPGPPDVQLSHRRRFAGGLDPPSPSPSPSPSPRGRWSSARAAEPLPPAAAGRFFAEPSSALTAAVGVPVAPALLLVEGVPLVEVLRWRRATSAADGGGGSSHRNGQPRSGGGGAPAAAASAREAPAVDQQGAGGGTEAAGMREGSESAAPPPGAAAAAAAAGGGGGGGGREPQRRISADAAAVRTGVAVEAAVGTPRVGPGGGPDDGGGGVASVYISAAPAAAAAAGGIWGAAAGRAATTGAAAGSSSEM